jgi:hypothetical protein
MALYELIGDVESISSLQSVVGIMAILLYVGAEVWCISGTALSLKIQAWYDDVSMVAFYGSLHLTLIFRVMDYCVKNEYFEWPGYLSYFVGGIPAIAKDITMGCLICRVFDAVSMRIEESKYPTIIRWTYIGLSVHVCVLYAWIIVIGCCEISTDSFFVYAITMQSILSLEFIYGLVLFFIMRNGMDEESRKGSLIRWLTIILSYMLFVIVCRVIYNIITTSDAIAHLDPDMQFCVRVIVDVLTELTPCILITSFLFILSKMEGGLNESVASPAEALQ